MAASSTNGSEFFGSRHPRSPYTEQRVLIALACAFLTILLLRTAWVAEDAYISFRVTDNFLHGFGLRWNVDDRVQTYTDPLFLGIVTFVTWISGNVYFAAIAVSLLLTICAVLLIFWNASEIGLLTAATALIFSKAFVDFSISGLENPATHLAIAAYLASYWRKRDAFTLSLIAALAATNRMDTVLFFLPSLLAVYVRSGRRVWKSALFGWSPFLAWSLFSLFYYGFLLPNTAYAKLDTGIPRNDMILQGIVYYLNALTRDTATLFVIGLALALAFSVREKLLGLGILLNLIYIVRVGGDFMSARFFSAALFFGAAILARYWNPRPALAAAAIASIAALGFWVPNPTITSANAEFGRPWPVDSGGIADERAYYYPGSGLLRYHRTPLWPDNVLSSAGLAVSRAPAKVVVFGNIGMYGYFAGPARHVIDPLAVGDALLARLPITNGEWRVGHYARDLPAGYLETIATGLNQIRDPHLHEYYDHLHTIISGPLWGRQRFKEIFRFSVGRYNRLLPKK